MFVVISPTVSQLYIYLRNLVLLPETGQTRCKPPERTFNRFRQMAWISRSKYKTCLGHRLPSSLTGSGHYQSSLLSLLILLLDPLVCLP